MTTPQAQTAPQAAEAEQRLYRDFAAEHLSPLWTAREELMPFHPAPKARPHLWRWSILHPLAERAADLVPVGRGGERRAIALPPALRFSCPEASCAAGAYPLICARAE